ncbi:MAG TPA: helix-turn-helix domain-containing protein [Moraxellaceae bacterium]
MTDQNQTDDTQTQVQAPDAPLSRAERNRLQLRADIIQAAFAEFSARGYHQTAISDIAKRLGIGHGTFYRHFENKRDILEHVINEVTANIISALVAENAPTATASLEGYREQTARIARRLTEILTENPAMARMVLFEATSIDPEMNRRVLDLMDWAGKLTAAYMENGVRLGFFREDLDAKATGHAVVGMIVMSVLRFLRSPEDRDEQKRLGEAIQRLLVDGVARRDK